MPGKHYSDVIDMDSMFGKDVLDMDSMLGRNDLLRSRKLSRALNKRLEKLRKKEYYGGGLTAKEERWQHRAERIKAIKKGYSVKRGGWTSRKARSALRRAKVGPTRKASWERSQKRNRAIIEAVVSGMR